MLESLFYKISLLKREVFSCEYCEFFKKIVPFRTLSVAVLCNVKATCNILTPESD